MQFSIISGHTVVEFVNNIVPDDAAVGPLDSLSYSLGGTFLFFFFYRCKFFRLLFGTSKL